MKTREHRAPARSNGPSRRSDGVLSRGQIGEYRQAGVALAYDPVQIGWVRSDCEDDVSDGLRPRAVSVPLRAATSYRFRAWQPEDAPALARLLSAPRLWDYLPEAYSGPIEPNTALELIALSNQAEHHLVRAVEHGGRVIGQARLEFDGNDRATAEISYWLDETVWGQGHGSAIVGLFAAQCLRDRPDLLCLVARVHRDNAASARVLARAGFRQRRSPADDIWQVHERRRPRVRASS